MKALKGNLSAYITLLKHLDYAQKQEIISYLSNSLSDKKENEKCFFNCFGKLDTRESAEELIDMIEKSRNFKNRDIQL
jgi:hypothetical protein